MICDNVCCSLCCFARCMLAPACKLKVCDSCITDHPALLTRCSDCRAVACPDHTYICQECTDDTVVPYQFGGDQFQRAMIRCCACKRTYCSDCDGTECGAGSFPLLFNNTDLLGWSGSTKRHELLQSQAHADELGCIYCSSWPDFCTGLKAATLNELECAYEDWEFEASDAKEFAAGAAKDARDAALAASALAIEAAIKAQEARDAAGKARRAADKARLQAETLQRARTAAYELAARISLQRR